MELLSATDAIGPAFTRARSVLFGPDRKGGFFKLALVAALTQPAFFSSALTYPLQGVQFALMSSLQRHPVQWFSGGGSFAVLGVGLFALAALLGLLLWIGITYLFCRLRFVLFDLVLSRDGQVAAAWRKHPRQAWRYFGVLLLGILVMLLLGAVTAGPAFLHMIRAVAVIGRQGPKTNPFAVLGSMLPVFGALFALGLLWTVFDAIAQDFLLPPMALEDAPIESALGRIKTLFRDSPGQTLLYLLLRFVLGVGLSVVLMVVALLVVGLVAASCIALSVLLFHALWTHGLVGEAIFIACAAVMALIVVAIYLFAVTLAYGLVGMFKQSYALYFYAPRYPELGGRLEPPENNTDAIITPPLPPSMPPLREPPPVW